MARSQFPGISLQIEDYRLHLDLPIVRNLLKAHWAKDPDLPCVFDLNSNIKNRLGLTDVRLESKGSFVWRSRLVVWKESEICGSVRGAIGVLFIFVTN